MATALDTRDWDALGALFTESATGYGVTGRAAIVEMVRDHLGGCGPSQHLLGNHRVECDLDGDPDRARSRTYGRVFHVGSDDLADLTYEGALLRDAKIGVLLASAFSALLGASYVLVQSRRIATLSMEPRGSRS